MRRARLKRQNEMMGGKKNSWQLFDVSAFDSVSLVCCVNDSSAVRVEVSVQQVEA